MMDPGLTRTWQMEGLIQCPCQTDFSAALSHPPVGREIQLAAKLFYARHTSGWDSCIALVVKRVELTVPQTV